MTYIKYNYYISIYYILFYIGNAACIYTEKGANAEWYIKRFRAGMLGVNIGIPVPREPFSFGGLYGKYMYILYI